jgi:acetyltransferase
MAGSLDGILKPRSVAVIGASQSSGKVGAVVLSNLLAAGFEGPIYPINPRSREIAGLPAYPRVADLTSPPDLAIVCTPAETVPNLVSECGAAGVRGMIILSAGFREVGAAGQELEARVRAAAGEHPSLRIIGPNCLGVISPVARLNASFAATFPLSGRVAFLSQSGALCTAILDWAADRALGFSQFVSIGNSLDVGIPDLLDYLATDESTEAIVLYLESIPDARAFMSAASACARRKPIVAYKAGRFAESAQAAASHTGALAGVDSVYEAALERAGVVRVFSIGELFECAQLLAGAPWLFGERLAIVTNAGGPGVMACDALLARTGSLAHLADSTIAELDTFLPEAWPRANPVDVLGDATPERFARAVQVVSADSNVDVVLAILTPQAMTDPTGTARAVLEVARQTNKPLLASWMGGPLVREGADLFEAAGIPTAATPDDAINALMHLIRYTRSQRMLYETPREIPLSFAADRQQLRDSLVPLLHGGRRILSESDAKKFLAAYGIDISQSRFAATADDAVQCAQAIGFPVVLKIVSPQITHKTDVGGVALSLQDEGQLRAAFARMMADVRRAQPSAEIEGVSIQPMIQRTGGVELILGAKKDPVFGPVILVGLGGIAAELFQDRALGLPPLNERLVLHMLQSLKAWPLVSGYRGRKAVAEIDRLIETVLRFSAMISDFPEILEFDVNPLLLRDDQIIALDARLVVDEHALNENSPRPFAHLAIRPYPEELVESTKLSDGTPITLRPIKPEDEPLWHELLASCSRESLAARFHGVVKTDYHEAAIRFCFVDYDRELAVVAEAEQGSDRKLLGVARLVADGAGRAEFAVLVSDAWQGRGLGHVFMDYCLRNVDRTRVHEIYGITGRDNDRMIKVFKRHGFQMVPGPDATMLKAVYQVPAV